MQKMEQKRTQKKTQSVSRDVNGLLNTTIEQKRSQIVTKPHSGNCADTVQVLNVSCCNDLHR
ncbi:hypothetical protein NP493_178g03034 [Ridgeia piscesae]|uniref:Uncharacterized protein n=1 Tax=Ridgeia piscesae TaxID=27915 RepID=A0AAD9UF59_RIDPI|nr:hypothetical protein NP493_178g03034 [Ridgeia piscesae]